MKRLLLSLLLVSSLVGSALGQELGGSQKSIRLPQPEGSYPIGYSKIVLSTDARDELSKDKSATRVVLIETWYPALKGTDERKSYATPAIGSSLSEAFPFPKGFAADVVTNSFVGAKPAEGKFPVIIFSHGLSWPITLYQSLAEDLASRGYIFIGVNHPHGAFIDYGGGRTLDQSAWPDIKDEKESNLMLARFVSVWAGDLKSVLSALSTWTERDSQNPISGHLDMNRVGIAGHSYGGTAAATLTGDSRVKAVVALEGEPRQEDGSSVTVHKPMLHIIGGYNRLEMEGNGYLPSDGAPVYQAVVNGTGHAYFSDLIFLYKHYADKDWLARHRYETDPGRVLQITRDYLAAFFGHYLNGEEKSVLLTPPSFADRVNGPPRKAGYPEVDLTISVH